jgi:retron-type reverse transcriptase
MLISNVKLYPLNQSPLYNLQSRKKLARLLNYELSDLRDLTKLDVKYRERLIESRDRKPRLVQEPFPELKRLQARLHDLLLKIALPDYVFSPARGRSHIDNAERHKGQRVVRGLDVKNFFPSTPFSRVNYFFLNKLHCSPDVSWLLSQLVTYKNYLPTGAPSSPIVAYYAYYDMWESISKIVSDSNCLFSLYVDDITISGDCVSKRLMWKVKSEIHNSGLIYHKEKHYSHGISEVTGIIIEKDSLVLKHEMHKRAHEVKMVLSSASLAEKDTLELKFNAYQAYFSQVLSRN